MLNESGARAQLVDAIRMLERANVVDYNGHFSARVGDNRMLINSGASVRGALTAEAYFDRIDQLSEEADERAEEILGALYDYAEQIIPMR